MLALSTLGGILHKPLHPDSVSYRIPRVLHWLWENRWHWIETRDLRMNVVAAGTEWLWAPGLLLFDDERWLFFYNAVSFALLPGLIFAFLIRAGVSKRVAWWWMWLLPAGYCYALQAGGLATDSYSTVFALAAVLFALKARDLGHVNYLWISLLAAALLTGTKQINVLLLPLWFVPFIVNWRLLLSRPIATGIILVFGIFASVLPMAIINIKHVGAWQGFTKNYGLEPHSPFWGIVGNAFAISAQNLLPPVFPWAPQWNDAMQRFLATPFGGNFAGFESFGHLHRAPSEVSAGLGLLTSSLLLLGLFGRKRRTFAAQRMLIKWIHVMPWLLLVIFMAKVGVYSNARYLAAMYPFLSVVILARAGTQYRSKPWRMLAYSSAVATILLLISSRQRPLLPAQQICTAIEKIAPSFQPIQKVKRSYSLFSDLREAMDSITRAIPNDQSVVGYATEFGMFELCLWQPFGSRRVYRFSGDDDRLTIKRKGVSFLVLDPSVLKTSDALTIEDWLKSRQGEIVLLRWLRHEPEKAPEPLYFVRLP